MKPALISLFLFLSSTSFAALKGLNMTMLAGTYVASSQYISAKNRITIGVDGDVTLVETTAEGSLECSGKATLENNILSCSMVCANGAAFDQRIDLTKVKNLKSFSAPVFSSLFGAEVPFTFVKVLDNTNSR